MNLLESLPFNFMIYFILLLSLYQQMAHLKKVRIITCHQRTTHRIKFSGGFLGFFFSSFLIWIKAGKSMTLAWQLCQDNDMSVVKETKVTTLGPDWTTAGEGT